MATPAATSAPIAVLDANLMIGYCANEASTVQAATDTLDFYAANGWRLSVPGVAIGEVIYVLCNKHKAGELNDAEYDDAVRRFKALLLAIEPPPTGDTDLVSRSVEILGNFGCSRANDSIYIALAEQLAALGTVELATFDTGMKSQAATSAPTVVVRLLPVATP